jgi:hypothetical protein
MILFFKPTIAAFKNLALVIQNLGHGRNWQGGIV